MATDKFRIDPTDRGQFQVRVRQNPGGQAMWFDAGDPCDTRTDAEAKMAEFQALDDRAEYMARKALRDNDITRTTNFERMIDDIPD